MAKKPVDPVFNYLIARPWDESRPDSLCIYSFFSAEIQRGTMIDAQKSLEHVRNSMKIDGETKTQIRQWGIYIVGTTRII